jgi:hypothetical protein
VCATCAGDVASCGEQPSHSFRLGRGTLLAAVDPEGQHAIARASDGLLHRVSLALGRYLEGPALGRGAWALLARRGAVVLASRPKQRSALRAVDWTTGAERELGGERPALTVPSLSDGARWAVFASARGHAELAPLGARRHRTRRPLGDEALVALAMAESRGWLAVGAASGLWLARDDGRLLRFGPARPAIWVGLAGSWLAGVFDDGRWLSVHAFELSDSGARAAYSWSELWSVERLGEPRVARPVTAALAGERCRLALAHDAARVAVHYLGGDRTDWLTAGAEGAVWLGFARRGELLVIGDRDSSVSVRPWRRQGHALEIDRNLGTAGRSPRGPW